MVHWVQELHTKVHKLMFKVQRLIRGKGMILGKGTPHYQTFIVVMWMSLRVAFSTLFFNFRASILLCRKNSVV